MRARTLRRIAGFAALGAAVALGVLRVSAATDAPSPGALDRPRRSADELPAAEQPLAEHGFELSSSRRVAPGLYLLRRGSEVCQLVVRPGGGGGACNPGNDVFAGRALWFGTGGDGDPAQPQSFWIAGVGRPNVRSVRIHFGSLTRDLPLTDDGGFSYEATADDLAAGSPTSVDALGPSRKIVATYRCPQG